MNPTMEMILDPQVGADVGSIGKTSAWGMGAIHLWLGTGKERVVSGGPDCSNPTHSQEGPVSGTNPWLPPGRRALGPWDVPPGKCGFVSLRQWLTSY